MIAVQWLSWMRNCLAKRLLSRFLSENQQPNFFKRLMQITGGGDSRFARAFRNKRMSTRHKIDKGSLTTTDLSSQTSRMPEIVDRN